MSKNLMLRKGTNVHFYGKGAILNESIAVSERVTDTIEAILTHSQIDDEQDIIERLIALGILTRDVADSGEYFISGRRNVKSFESVVFELTSSCTLQCKFCYKSASPFKKSSLSYDCVCNIVNRLSDTKKNPIKRWRTYM